LINGNMTKLKDAGGFMKQGPAEQETQAEEDIDA
ncbi:TPA: phage portal protein, partial [Streptococcus suis]|nr:phage portal protein [Streptococcus suis]